MTRWRMAEVGANPSGPAKARAHSTTGKASSHSTTPLAGALNRALWPVSAKKRLYSASGFLARIMRRSRPRSSRRVGMVWT